MAGPLDGLFGGTGTSTGGWNFNDIFNAKKAKGESDPYGFRSGEETMRAGASDIANEEQRRYQQGMGTATSAYDSLTKTLGQGVDTSLLFSQASDAIGARSRDALSNVRSSLGARGLNPNSGAAGGMLERLMFNQQNALVGAELTNEIEAKKQRDVNAATSFAAALNLANLTNAPVSGARLETEQNLYEGALARYGIDKQAKSAKNAQKSNVLGGLVGAGASILGGLL